MALIGNIEPFDDTIEPFASYRQRLEQFFAANQIPDARRVAAFISIIGAKSYKVLRDILAPDAPSTKNYEELCTALANHYSPEPLRLAERLRLKQRLQKEGESINEYVAQLKSLSLHSGYEGAVLDEALRDTFIGGLRHSHIREKLITKPPNTTFRQAVDTALQMETASKESTHFAHQHEKVHAMHTKRRQPRQPRDSRNQQSKQQNNNFNTQIKPCFRCTAQHDPASCKHKESTCNYCSKQGHIERACISKSQDMGVRPRVHLSRPKPKRGSRHYKPQKSVHQVDDFTSDSDEFIQACETGSTADKFMVTPTVNGIPLQMEIDTGASVSIITQPVYQKNFASVKLRPAPKTLRTYTGEVVKTLGIMAANVKIHGQRRRLHMYVTENGQNSLMGRDWLRSLRLNWAEIKAVHTARYINSTHSSKMSSE